MLTLTENNQHTCTGYASQNYIFYLHIYIMLNKWNYDISDIRSPGRLAQTCRICTVALYIPKITQLFMTCISILAVPEDYGYVKSQPRKATLD